MRKINFINDVFHYFKLPTIQKGKQIFALKIHEEHFPMNHSAERFQSRDKLTRMKNGMWKSLVNIINFMALSIDMEIQRQLSGDLNLSENRVLELVVCRFGICMTM